MKLIIAEKQQVAQAIADTLENITKRNGYLENDEYIITWASGHLLQNVEPEDVDPKYEKRVLEDLPIPIDINWKLKPKTYNLKKAKNEQEKEIFKRLQAKVNDQLNVIEKYLKDSSISEIIHAGDPDDEGQLLIDELIEYFNCVKPVSRLLINDNNPNKIKEAFTKIESNNKFIPLGRSARARSIADLYLGINGSRFFSIKSKQRLNVGRVKTPVLGLIVSRYQEVKNHTKSKYYTLLANTLVQKASNINEKEEYNKIKLSYESEFLDQDKKKKLFNSLMGEFERLAQEIPLEFTFIPPKEILENGKVIDKTLLENIRPCLTGNHSLEISKDITKKSAPLPFNLIELQQYANKKWGYSATKTLEITQTLRDKYKAITYNRSDCQYLSMEHYKESNIVIPQILDNLKIIVPDVDYNRVSECFNDGLITAHHGIIPTNTKQSINSFTEEERNIYTIIANYYIAQFLPEVVSEKTTGTIEVLEEIILKATSVKVLDYGYKLFLNDKEEDEEKTSILSSLYSGKYSLEITDTNILEKETTPKKLYTEATLLKDMSSISKYVKDPILRKSLKDKDKGKKGENGGIGTPATRAKIIEDLKIDNYITQEKNNLIPTELGIKYFEYLPDEIKTADVTAKWWLTLSEIQESKSEPAKLISEVERDFLNIMSKDFKQMDYTGNSKAIGICPMCKKNVYENKFSFFCEGYKDDPKCTFSIWKDNKATNTKITEAQAKILMENKSITIKGMKYKLNSLGKLQVETEKIECPKCKKELTDTPKALSCECKFIFWKNNFSIKEIKELFKGKAIDVELKNKEGKTYKVNISLKEDYTGYKINNFINKK